MPAVSGEDLPVAEIKRDRQVPTLVDVGHDRVVRQRGEGLADLAVVVEAEQERPSRLELVPSADAFARAHNAVPIG